MIITVQFDYQQCNKSLPVDITAFGQTFVLDLADSKRSITITADAPMVNQLVGVDITCHDSRIINFPLTVTNIILDDFYQGPKLVFKGRQLYDQNFFASAEKQDIYLDPHVNDSNCLNFTGCLAYQFSWPFWKNIFA